MPNPRPPIPPKREDSDIEVWIDKHTSRGSAVFRQYYADYKDNIITKAGFARKMGVAASTLGYWIELYERKLKKSGETAA